MVMTIIAIPFKALDKNPVEPRSRVRRTYMHDPQVAIDSIDQPRGIPNKFKAMNEIASGFTSIFPWISTHHNTEWINYIYYNQQRFINCTDSTLHVLGEQLLATSTMTWQSRQALDWVLAEKGGVCAFIGECCCTFIPYNTGPRGTFTMAMNKLKNLRKEVKGNAGYGYEDWFSWLNFDWQATLVKIGLTVGVCMVMMGIIFCCCISIP